MYTDRVLYINPKGNIMKLVIATLLALSAVSVFAQPAKTPAAAPVATAPAVTAPAAPHKADAKAKVKPVKSEPAKKVEPKAEAKAAK